MKGVITMKKNYLVQSLVNACGYCGMAVGFVGFCGAIISTIDVFLTMAAIGTAMIGIAQFFMED